MKWLGNLLFGTFTRHPTTKLLALLLSLGLFGFVQASLSATQVIRQLTLRFNLASMLTAKYVLLTEEIPFADLSISGMRSKVDPLARLYRGEPVVNLAIDDKFAKVYGEEDARTGMIRIRITKDLFADDRLFSRDITVGEFAERLVILDPIDVRTAKVEVDTTQTPAAITDAKHEYEGKIDLKLNVKTVTIEGPASAFTGDVALFVSVPNLVRQLARFQTTGEKGEAKLSPVEIRWQGVDPVLLLQLRISGDELGGDEMSAGELKRRIVATCPVTKRKQPMTLKDIPIDIRHPEPREFDLTKDYEVLGGLIFTDGELREGRMRQLEVKLPASLAGDREFLGNLVAVLDVGAREVDAEAGEPMYVPFYLDVRDRSQKDDIAALALVDLVAETRPEFRRRTAK